MAHREQQEFFDRIKTRYPDKFKGVSVIDFGSLDVNGSLRHLFVNSLYIGVDIVAGKNVDMISEAHKFTRDPVDVIVSGEMLEHDEHWLESLCNMYRLLKSGGLMAVSAAGPKRAEHGTKRTGAQWGTAPDYYENITDGKLRRFMQGLPNQPYPFQEWSIEIGTEMRDAYFHGVKS